MEYPRVLIVVMGRINAADNINNGLLLRNLFARWPRENLAQIYSSGDNGDAGFFGYYYQLGPRDRWLGKLFYRMKYKIQRDFNSPKLSFSAPFKRSSKLNLVAYGKRFLFDTGLYELIFRPCISREMERWVWDFNPDLIFAQGYNLAFTWLPLMLAKRFQLPVVYYPTDDWPCDLYVPKSKYGIKHLMHNLVQCSVQHLVELSAVRIAFNTLMEREYQKRYQQEFITLMHGDHWERYSSIAPRRLYPEGVYWIVSTGVFDSHRLPLLNDLEQACEILDRNGFKVRATIFPVNYQDIEWPTFHYLDIQPCPTHEQLPGFLKGANVLFLPERFDTSVRDIRLCVSSKAHLFMFSERPIVVYADSKTGVAQYAAQEGWGAVVKHRDPSLLASVLERLFINNLEAQGLVLKARHTIYKYHDLSSIQNKFLDLVKRIAEV
jgi:glycosyltransferase involved in cell wall biosynthesis